MNELNNIFSKIRTSSIIEKLILLNSLFFLIALLFKSTVLNWIALSSDLNLLILKPWTIASYSIVHLDFFHLLSNVLILYYIGNLFLTFFHKSQLLTVYIGGLVSGALLFLVIAFIKNDTLILIGASGAVTAVFVALATKIPHYELKLLLFGFVKLWVLAAIWVGLSLIQLTSMNYGGAIAHLGGALFGYLYIYLSLNNFTLFSFNKKSKHQFKKIHKSKVKKSNVNIVDDERQAKIDVILDKISNSGYDSLSKEEREFLFKQGR